MKTLLTLALGACAGAAAVVLWDVRSARLAAADLAIIWGHRVLNEHLGPPPTRPVRPNPFEASRNGSHPI